MFKTLSKCILILSLLFFGLHCGKDTPLTPGDNGATVDTTAQKTPYLIPLALGASWKYSLEYERKVYDGNIYKEISRHFGIYSLNVTAFNSVGKSYVLQGRFVLDSLAVYSATYYYPYTVIDTFYILYPGRDVLPVNPDTSVIINIVTVQDTLWYSFGQNLQYFMPWDLKDLNYIRLNLRILQYPWEHAHNLRYIVEVGYRNEDIKPFIYGFGGLVPYGSINGAIVPDSGGVTGFEVFRAPGLISSHTDEYLTYKLLEYTPGAP